MLSVGLNDQRLARVTQRARDTPAAREYRILRLDEHGQIAASDVFPAHDDAVALVIARARESSAARELWEAKRLIAVLPAGTAM